MTVLDGYSSSNLHVGLRPVTAEDEEFLLQLYACTREAEMALVPWTLEQQREFINSQFVAQRTHYQSAYPRAEHHIIMRDERRLGRLYVDRQPSEIRIIDITILPEYRNSGIGGGLIGNLADEARRDRRTLTIYVESFNPSIQLFERIGFKPKETNGVHILMELLPPVAS